MSESKPGKTRQDATRPRARGRPRRPHPSPKAETETRTLKAQARFLGEFAQCGNVLRAAGAAGVARQTVYRWLEQPRFKSLYDSAHEDALDRLEEEARRRAVDGVDKPVYQGGERVGSIREYSDTLLIALLKGKRPDTFRDRFEHLGKGGKQLFPEVSKMSTEDLRAEFLSTAQLLGLKVVDGEP